MWIDDKLTNERGWRVWDTGGGVWWCFNWMRDPQDTSYGISFQAVDSVITDRPQVFSKWAANSDPIISHVWEALTPEEAQALWAQIFANPVPIVIRVAL